MSSSNTDIRGIPASYALYKMPGEPNGTYAVVKVLDVPTKPEILDTPLHLCDRSQLITQHRLGNNELPHREAVIAATRPDDREL